MSRRSSWIFAVLISVLLHGALFFALSRMRVDAPARQSSSITELELVYMRPPASVVKPPAPKPEDERPSTPGRVPPSRKPERPSSSVAQAPETTQPAPSAPEPPSEVAQGPGEGTPEGQRAADAPRTEPGPKVSLIPKGLWGSGEPTGKPFQSGRTLRNDGTDVPDAREVARQQAAEAKERVDGWAADALATARAESGAVHPYFSSLQDRFAKKLVNPPSPDLKVLGSRVKREQVDAIKRFGETGTPFVAEKRDRRLEQRNRLQAAVEAGRAANMFMVDVTQPVLALAAVLEVRQARDGTLLDLKVLEGSGDPKFDEWAMLHLRDALASADPPPESGRGLRDDGLRSRWRLEEYLGNPRVKIVLIGVY
ncbi:ferrichrome ABC transporter substrate-binding protein [Myxococcus stipitatus]|uniref:ferrichrome ABC transporter substrate-binding protein n=1 Tax=Myxococcus stipitatus TaxID=83455 RepID=UPI0030CF5193